MADVVKHSTGTGYIFFFLRIILSLGIFIYWSDAINLFNDSGLDLFFPLFTISILSGVFARVIGYSILLFLNFLMNRKRTVKRAIPSFIQMNFGKSINRYSFVSIFATVIMCLIYSFSIEQYIIDYFFPVRTFWADILGYFIIKAGTYVISWIFLKFRGG